MKSGKGAGWLGWTKPSRGCGSWSSRTTFSPPRSFATRWKAPAARWSGRSAGSPTGLRLAEQEALDGAVLDVNLNGDWCFPIAEALRRRDVPFIFLTGYDDAAIIPVELRPARQLSKPVLGPHLIEALSEVI